MKAKSEKTTQVSIAGERIDTSRRKENDNIVFGIFLVIIGGLFLLNNFGVVPWIIWNYIIDFWPVFLILAGLRAILGNSLVSRIIMVIVSLAIFGLVLIYALYQVGSPLISNLPVEIINFVKNFENIKR